MGLFTQRKKVGGMAVTPTAQTPNNTTNGVTTPQVTNVPTTPGKKEQPEKISPVTWFVKAVLWLSFIGFLSTSIPHVAWLYHTFEGATIDLGFTTVSSWLVSYTVAIGIDVTVACLAYVLERGIQKVHVPAIWFFTIVLGLLSWYANYMYDMGHDPVTQSNIWGIQLLFGVTTGYITPIIISSVPVFVLAYTFMLQIVGNTAGLSAQDLEARAIELEALNIQKARIRKAKGASFVGGIQGVIHSGKDILGAFNEDKTTTTGQDTHTEDPTIVTYENGHLDTIQFPGGRTVQVGTAESETVNKVQSPDKETVQTQAQVTTIRERTTHETDKLTPVFNLPAYTIEDSHITDPQVTALPVQSVPPIVSRNGHTQPVYIPAYRRKNNSV